MNLGVKPLSVTSSSASWKSSDGVSDQFPVGLRVLVVDDDPTCLRILEKMLRNCLYEVTKCNRAEIALQLLRDNKNGFDVVISEVHMPDMDGFKLLEHIGLEMDLPVIMMSADDCKNLVMKGVTHGACDYLIKPVRMELLKNIWQHVVRKKKHEWKERDFEHSGSADDGEQRQKPPEDVDYSSIANEGKMFNLDLLLSRRANSSGNLGISSTSRLPPQAVIKDSHPPRSKGKSSSGAAVVGTSRAKDKKPAPSAKRPKPDIPDIRHGKGKSLCPHIPDTDPSQDLWHHPELGVRILRHFIRDADLAYTSPQSARELGNSAYCDLARMPAVIETLIVRAEAFEEMRSKVEDLKNKCCDLTRELSQLQSNKDSTHKQLEEELTDVRGKLKNERSTGRGYLDSLGGQRYMKSVKDKAVLKYKKSEDFKSLVSAEMLKYKESEDIKSLVNAEVLKYKESDDFANYLADSSIPVFDECLAYCRQRLLNSGRFPGEKFEFLDPDWVEMIDVPPFGALATARSSQGTSLLPVAEADEDVMNDTEGDDIVP